MQERRINLGRPIALLGVVLLLVSLFLEWFEVNAEGHGELGLTAWEAFEALDLVLAGIGIAAIIIIGSHLLGRRSPIPERWEPALATAALVIVGAGILNHPPAAHGFDERVGAWLALAGAVLFVLGSLVGRARINISMTFDDDDRTRGARPAPPAPASPEAPPQSTTSEPPTERL
jgi:hypothetical protein